MGTKKKREHPAEFIPDIRPSYKIAATLIILFAFQAVWHARNKSATYDEPGHLTISNLLWKTDHTNYELGHPPLIRYLLGIPSFFTDPSLPSGQPYPLVDDDVPLMNLPGSALYFYSTDFLYYNRVPAETLLMGSRIVNILLGCSMMFVLFLWSTRSYGTHAGLLTLALAAFCPNLIAHGSLATTDMGGVAFAILFLFSFSFLLEKNRPGRALFCGILLGLALLSKTTNIILAPLFVANILFIKGFYLPDKDQEPRERFVAIFKTILITAFTSWLVLCAGYGFDKVFGPHTLLDSDWRALDFGTTLRNIYRTIPLPDTFIKGICYNMVHDQRGHGGFLMGSFNSFGWWYYFPAAFLVKTPTVTLLLALYWAVLAYKRKIKLEAQEILCLSTIALLGIIAMQSKITIGLRHILLCYPLLYILLGRIARTVPFNNFKTRIFAGALAALLAIEVLSVTPHYLAFFNRISGGPKKGIAYLSDSNIDWGQDLKNLADFLKEEGDPEIVLAYFGTAVPEYYGIKYQSIPTVWSYPKSKHVNSVVPIKEYMAVSATILQGTYFSNHTFYSDMLKNKKPIKVIGYSIYVYDITRDLRIHESLLDLYRMTGELDKFLRQAGRLKKLKDQD